MDFEIQNIFPTPIVTTSIGRKFSQEEIVFFDQCLETRISNLGNTSSENSYVLDSLELATIKQEITACIKYYTDTILKPQDDVEIYITQSWLNVTEQNQNHHKHTHTNSFLSGVLYIQTNTDNGKIFFHNNTYTALTLVPTEFNSWNSKSWWIPTKVGDIVLFPSSLAHDVPTNTSSDPRISLSFNTFIKGTIGKPNTLTQLKLK